LSRLGAGRILVLLGSAAAAFFLLATLVVAEQPQPALAQGASPTPARANPTAVVVPTSAPAATTPPATPAPAEEPEVWVATHSPTDLYAGPEADAASTGSVRIGLPFKVLAPQDGSRLMVYSPASDGVGWIGADAVGPIPTPSADRIAEMIAAPAFEPWWAMTHTAAVGYSSPGPDAIAWSRIPQWRYLQVVAPEENGRVLTVDPRTDGYGYVDVTTLGAVGAPPDNYFAGPPPDDETLNLPGRIIGTVDRYERPSRENYFTLDRLFHADPVTVRGVVNNDEGSWYRVGDSAYVQSNNVRVPKLPDRTFQGRWIDANISEPVLVTAYEGDRPVYSALAVKGTVAFQTPTGVFRILRRVMNETMDSATLGIPRTSPNGYYLKDVLYTQYFTGDGAALHYNYWRSNWGYAGSHGCMGMNFEDSKFFWDFGSVGTPVYVHT